LLAERGYRSWVVDWPGSGRSGYRDLTTLRYADVVAGFVSLLRDVIAEPVILVPHGSGATVAWKLVETLPHLVAGVVALAPAPPGNVVAPAEVLGDANGVVTFRQAPAGATHSIDRRVPYTHESTYVAERSVASSTQFPRAAIPSLNAGYQGMSPLMQLERLGIEPGLPSVADPAGFAGKRIRLMAGDRDPEHGRDVELRTVGQLRAWGADAELVWLPDFGRTTGRRARNRCLTGQVLHLS
jgi:pimeloyl-ACP methyl ester carboxylesterase